MCIKSYRSLQLLYATQTSIPLIRNIVVEMFVDCFSVDSCMLCIKSSGGNC